MENREKIESEEGKRENREKGEWRMARKSEEGVDRERRVETREREREKSEWRMKREWRESGEWRLEIERERRENGE